MNFPSTLLAATNDTNDIKQADLDLLKKINMVSTEALAAATAAQTTANAAAVISSGSNANGYWLQISDGTLHQWGWGFITWVSGQQFITKNITLPISFLTSEVYFTISTAGYKLTDPSSVNDTAGIEGTFCSGRILTANTATILIGYVSAIADTARRLFVWHAFGKWK
jgi:hypothetical protein